MKVCITGANGFVGGYLARRFWEQGVEVLATGRRARSVDIVPFQSAELLDSGQCDAVCRGAQVVVHCAGLSSPWASRRAFYQGNVLPTEALLAAAARAGVEHFVFLSTSGVYFANSEGYLVEEGAELPPTVCQHPYVASKRRGERLVADSGLDYTIVRPRAIYGPGDRSLLPRIIDRLQKGRLPIVGSGRTLCSMTHVENLAQALALVLAKPVNGCLNVSDGDPVNLWEVITMVARAKGLRPPQRRISYARAYGLAGVLEGLCRLLPWLGEPPLTRYTASLLGRSQSLSIAKARRTLGFEPLFDSFAGVERTLARESEGYSR